MKATPLQLPEVLLLDLDVFHDDRGCFYESYSAHMYGAAGAAREFVQDNVSVSKRGVLRGLHVQYPVQQAKLVTCVLGSVLDVAVDVRVGSPTFGMNVAVELAGARQLLVPRGFAHGFFVMSEQAVVQYKCDGPYDPESEIGIRWNDEAIGVKWPVRYPTLSGKDALAPALNDIASRLPRY